MRVRATTSDGGANKGSTCIYRYDTVPVGYRHTARRQHRLTLSQLSRGTGIYQIIIRT